MYRFPVRIYFPNQKDFCNDPIIECNYIIQLEIPYILKYCLFFVIPITSKFKKKIKIIKQKEKFTHALGCAKKRSCLTDLKSFFVILQYTECILFNVVFGTFF